VKRFLTLLLLAAVGCGPSAGPPAGAPSAEGFPVTVTDGRGRAVTVARRPGRIVCLTPATTETLFAVGAGPSVVAVTTTDTYPPEVKGLPTVGGYSPNTVSTEAILTAQPDLVLATTGFHDPVTDALERLGLTVLTRPDPDSFEELAAAIELTGRATGCGDRAAAVSADLLRRVALVRGRTAAVPAADRPRVLYVLWDDPLLTAGPASFVGRMIEEAGGVNVFADAAQQFPRVSDEAVVSRRPDLILAPDHGRAGLPDRLRARPGWGAVPAVRAGRIRTVDEDLVNRPGPRLIDGLEAVERLIREGR